MQGPLARLAAVFFIAALAVAAGGCSRLAKRQVTVPSLLAPLAEADAEALIREVNRVAAVRSLSGKVDIQFLDTSFAECGIAEKFRTADGRVIVQRNGQIYLLIQGPLGIKIAEMSSNGERFWVALYQGDDKYQRFAYGTNDAIYPRLDADGSRPDCQGDGARREAAMQRATVSALSSLRPQHFTDAILLRPVAADNSNLIYAVSETFEEERDTRPRARKDSRVVRGYYVMAELEPGAPGRARVLRRFWFDRVGGTRLARVQTYGARGELTTDVVYGAQQQFGAGGGERLPSVVELTRPQDRYSIRVGFQEPGAVRVNQTHDPEVFVLQNSSNLQEVNLDARANP